MLRSGHPDRSRDRSRELPGELPGEWPRTRRRLLTAALTAGTVVGGLLGGGVLALPAPASARAGATPVIVIGPPLPVPTTMHGPVPSPTPSPTPNPVPNPGSSSPTPLPALPGDSFVPASGLAVGDPTASTNQVLAQLMDNIRHTPAGATIQLVGYSFSLTRVSDALLEAHARGVHVQVVMDGHSGQWLPAKALAPVLGTDATASSFLVLTHGSARGTGGVTHQKSWTFSQVGRTPDVVMVGSTNLTGYGTQVQFSDAFTFAGHADVYDAYAGLFAVQKLDRPVARPFRDLPFTGGDASFFPAPGSTAATDPVVARIDALPGAASTHIRVSAYSWWDTRGTWIAQALAAKARAGAQVSVVAGESVSSRVRSVLAAAGVPIHSGVYADGKRIHTKLMLADHVDPTGVRRTSIWTGSDNWANQSFRNEETVLRVDDSSSYDAYVRFYDLLDHR